MIHIDIETLCDLDVRDVGVYAYAAHSSFRIILLSYAWDNGDVVTLDCYNEAVPGQTLFERAPDVWDELHFNDAELWAHNASFEMVCIGTYYRIPIVRSCWHCTSVGAAYLGLPMALDKVAKVLALPEQKAARGKALIKLFSSPQKRQLKKYGDATYITPELAPLEWEEYKEYNKQDVITERAVHAFISRYPGLPDIEHEYYIHNEEINAAGVYIDVDFVTAAIQTCETFLAKIFAQIIELGAGEITNPNSDDQIKAWIMKRGVNIPSLNKDYLKDYVNYALLPDDVAAMLKLRDAKSKTSISKYTKMLEMLCPDGRVKGIQQFYGASTGRFAGRGLQGQNMKLTFDNVENILANAKRLGVSYEAVERIVGNALETAKAAITAGLGELLFDDVTDVVSKLARTAIIAPPGCSLIPVDFASIEATMLAYAAGEEWALEEFRGEGKIYEATAARMYGVTKEDVIAEGKSSPKRKRGKIATLALGYQGGAGALVTSGALRAGMTEDELPEVVGGYRRANPMTCAFWKRVENAVRHVVKNKCAIKVHFKYMTLKFRYERNYLFITLPSGRSLAYYGPHLVDGYRIRYWGLKTMKGSTAKAWTVVDLYGGLITENIIQAMSRDCLVEAMYRMRGEVLIVMHVHDEIIGEAPDDEANDVLVYMQHCMSISPLWAKELPLKGVGFVSKYYRKD